jgi:hypothetical protein
LLMETDVEGLIGAGRHDRIVWDSSPLHVGVVGRTTFGLSGRRGSPGEGRVCSRNRGPPPVWRSVLLYGMLAFDQDLNQAFPSTPPESSRAGSLLVDGGPARHGSLPYSLIVTEPPPRSMVQ